MTRRTAWVMCLALACFGCGDSSDGPTEPVALEWPPAATVYFDEKGVFNADCDTDEDCAMALGYHHAFDRFVQLDIRRRFATGRLSDVVNKELLESLDLLDPLIETSAASRALYSTRDGVPTEESLLAQASPKVLSMLEAYSVGVNQWIADVRAGRNGAVFPREFESPILAYTAADIPEWTPADSLATVLLLVEDLTNDESSAVREGAARARINNDLWFSDMYSRRRLNDSTILEPGTFPAGGATAALQVKRNETAAGAPLNAGPALLRLQARLEQTASIRSMLFGRGSTRDERGSNNWAISPRLTVDGNALLSNDPHLDMAQPSVFYVVHLDAKTNGDGEIHTAGYTFPGLPWVLIGQNEDIAWGATTTSFDQSDVYIEELVMDGDTPTGVMFNGEPVDFIRRTFTVAFNDGTSVERELLFLPQHGAVRELDVENGVAITLRWSGNDLTTDAEFPIGMALATSVEEARDLGVANSTSLGQNWVIADRAGNIGWFPYNRVPKRDWATNIDGPAPPWLPLDGRGQFEWTEFFELSELPQAFNPEAGYIATANNDMAGYLIDGDPTNDATPVLQSWAVAGYRHAQIVRLLEAEGDQHTLDTMLDTVSNVDSLIGEDMVPGIVEIANDDMTTLSEEARKVVNALESWDFRCPTGLDGTNAELSPLTTVEADLLSAAGCAAFHAVIIELNRAMVGDENDPEGELDPPLTPPLGRGPNFATFYCVVDPTQLAAGPVYWDDITTQQTENRFDIMAAVLDTAGNRLIDELGEQDETRWAWGRLHGLVLVSDLSGLSAVFEAFNNPPTGEPLFANDGGLFTVDVANPDPDFVQRAGPAFRHTCELFSTGPSCVYQLAGGQSADINSPNYEDLLVDYYLPNEPLPLPFDIAEAAANAARTIDYRGSGSP